MHLSFTSILGALSVIATAVHGAAVPYSHPINYLRSPIAVNTPEGVSVTMCQENAAFTLESVALEPSTPHRNQDIKVSVHGELHQEITQGATYSVEVFYGSHSLLSKNGDACQLLGQTGTSQQCPLAPGPIDLSLTQHIPWYAPPGSYKAVMKTYLANGQEFGCWEAALSL
ncbi:Phosphatidylglycerol/phosphatidylinositol transfer protein [Dimargaris verticillata]|uniref:Phosphatidylglycerol/phosphatidylinositol transfer protein n=1 Tax=Dimargaris verticillata TaxID=2761393 RepID=A0A9W8B296_9FUNG|nr:Phosphatidylglycerol/phosphatidylinositol transfer protein [Dimargaris verticillata]